MGKGDKKSRRGKINAGSYGKSRPRKIGVKKFNEAVAKSLATEIKVDEPQKTTVKKTATKSKAETASKAEKPATKTKKAAQSEEQPKTTRKKKTQDSEE